VERRDRDQAWLVSRQVHDVQPFRLGRAKDVFFTFFAQCAQNWAQLSGVNPSVETIFDWHTCRSMDFPIQTTSSSPEWSSVGEAEVGSGGDQPAKE
jgi:hypothetical protein